MGRGGIIPGFIPPGPCIGIGIPPGRGGPGPGGPGRCGGRPFGGGPPCMGMPFGGGAPGGMGRWPGTPGGRDDRMLCVGQALRVLARAQNKRVRKKRGSNRSKKNQSSAIRIRFLMCVQNLA